MINDFINAYPDVRINLDFSSLRVDLIAGEFDIVFRMGALEDSNLIAKKLVDMPIYTVASPEYLQEKGQLTHPSELKHHQCITGTVNNWRYFNILTPEQKLDVSVDGAFKCKNGRAMIFSALAGNGIVRLPLLYCFKEIAEQRLLPVFKDWDSLISPFYLVYVQDKYQPARLKTLIQFVNSNIAHYISQFQFEQ